jgi:cystathionine gamma-lyase
MRKELGISDTLIRLSVGIEHVDDLIADLESGFEAARAMKEEKKPTPEASAGQRIHA